MSVSFIPELWKNHVGDVQFLASRPVHRANLGPAIVYLEDTEEWAFLNQSYPIKELIPNLYHFLASID